MKQVLLFLNFFLLMIVKGQDITPYQFYNKKSEVVTAEKVVKDLANYDVVLFGEFHNNSINHWLQLKITQDLFKIKNESLVLGAEMFERDNQPQLNSYLSGQISEKNLKDSVRLWNNYLTDYKPLLDFAKNKNLKFIATNVPRRYAAQVAKQNLKSLEGLSNLEKTYIAKLPIIFTMDTPGYKEMKTMMGDHVDELKLTNFVAAQAIKDATMAESILRNFNKKQLFLHYNGNYHSKEYGGIYWYLIKANPKLKIAVISVFEAEDNTVNLPKANTVLTDYNLVIPADMTKTY